MRNLSLIILLFTLLMLSCTHDNIVTPTYENEAKLKKRTVFASLKSTTPLAIDKYEYNQNGKLSKISHYGGNYEILYNYKNFYYKDDRLQYKLNLDKNINSPLGYILIDSTTYQYDGEKLVIEKIFYPYADFQDYYNYEYSNNNLIKKSKFHKNELENYVTFEYSGDRNIKERYYSPTGENYRIITHFYDNNFRIKSEHNRPNGELLRRIKYTYDNNGNLIIEESKEMVMYSSMSDVVIRYEYY